MANTPGSARPRGHRTIAPAVVAAVISAILALVAPPSASAQEKPVDKTAQKPAADDYGRQLLLGGRQGTLADLRRSSPPNLARDAFPAPQSLDASTLSFKEHLTRASKRIPLKPESDYTLVVEVRAEGEGCLSVGLRWDLPDSPPGLNDQDIFLAIQRAPSDWTEKTFTFTTDPDPKGADVQVLLKAFGGAKATFRNLRIVEGWYADTPTSFKRPYRAEERKW